VLRRPDESTPEPVTGRLVEEVRFETNRPNRQIGSGKMISQLPSLRTWRSAGREAVLANKAAFGVLSAPAFDLGA
jgi:hypothetical protein